MGTPEQIVPVRFSLSFAVEQSIEERYNHSRCHPYNSEGMFSLTPLCSSIL